MNISQTMGMETILATVSAWAAEMLFGVISPKMSTTSVMMKVDTATAKLPNSCMETMVAIEEAKMLTRLFPIRIMVSSLSGCLRRRSTRCAARLPLFA